VGGCTRPGSGAAYPPTTTISQPAVTTTTAAVSEPRPPGVSSTTSRSTLTTRPNGGSSSTTHTAGASPESNATSMRSKEYERLPTDEKVIALTFDAAYEPKPLAAIIAALQSGGAKGTFFLTGEFVRDFPKEVQRIVDTGFPIGNHSFSHPDFTTLTDAKIESQLERTAQILEKAGAGDPKPLFRFPYGAENRRTRTAIARAGYVSVYWTIDTTDWKPERTAEQIESIVLRKLEPGAIVLMHVGSRHTADILPTLISDLKERGYGFVTVPEGLGLAR
jgi:peptidoglycan/xylan/chitin deacetylase (PgdA/CDA1 family)